MPETDEDERCCGTGTCMIDAQGRCWCGQQWDGTHMCRPEAPVSTPASTGTHGTVTLDSANG